MDIDATNRTQDPFTLRAAHRTPGVHGTEAGQFALVYELADARRRRMTGPSRIPEEVWDDMHRAHQLCDDLAARGQQVRFDAHRVDGRIVASLCDEQGTVLRRIGVGELLDTDPDPVPAA